MRTKPDGMNREKLHELLDMVIDIAEGTDLRCDFKFVADQGLSSITLDVFRLGQGMDTYKNYLYQMYEQDTSLYSMGNLLNEAYQEAQNNELIRD
jgi:hypothetical protein